MKSRLLKMRFVANRTETLDFKTCEGGSPEYVAAKKKLNELFLKHQNEQHTIVPSRVSKFAESSQGKVDPAPLHYFVESSLSNFGESNGLSKIASSSKTFAAYSLYINPLALFDIHFLIAAGCVVLIAVIERNLADKGIIGPAAILSGILKIGFPLVAFGSILMLISKLGVFL
jgi:hypothetical protein